MAVQREILDAAVMSRHAVFASLASLVIVVSGCGHQRPSALDEWASDVCVAFAAHEAKARPIFREFSTLLDNLQLATRSRMQADVRKARRTNRTLMTNLIALKAPDTLAGRLGQSLIDWDVERLQRNESDSSSKEVDAKLAAFSSSATNFARREMVSLLVGQLDADGGRVAVAVQVGVVKKRASGELTRAFKRANGCESWSGVIAKGEALADEGKAG
jgi:hypothetical protein